MVHVSTFCDVMPMKIDKKGSVTDKYTDRRPQTIVPKLDTADGSDSESVNTYVSTIAKYSS